MHKLAITGGPCAGKTTGLPYLSEKLSDRGLYPIIIPEAPTLLMTNNVRPGSAFDNDTFQYFVVRMMHELELLLTAAASHADHPRKVLLCDRGIPDCAAYMPAKLYEQILADLGLGTPVEARDGRYDAVFHLRTAALGAEAFYTNANNASRRETLEEARVQDERTLRAWLGHPHLRVIDNSTDFAGKLARLDANVCRVLGIPVPLEIERAYLCDPIALCDIPVPYQVVDIEQAYLFSNPDVVLRVRRRGQSGSYVYYRTEKREVRPSVRVETEEFISAQAYRSGLNSILPGTKLIRKQRVCFVYQHQYFELDRILLPSEEMYRLEIELTEENDTPTLPPFIRIRSEVTGDPRYGNRALAER